VFEGEFFDYDVWLCYFVGDVGCVVLLVMLVVLCCW
jgi:hypothetical protein